MRASVAKGKIHQEISPDDLQVANGSLDICYALLPQLQTLRIELHIGG